MFPSFPLTSSVSYRELGKFEKKGVFFPPAFFCWEQQGASQKQKQNKEPEDAKRRHRAAGSGYNSDAFNPFLHTSNCVITCWNKNMYCCCFKYGRWAPVTASPQVLWAELGLQELQELVASGRIFQCLLKREAPFLHPLLAGVATAQSKTN